MHVILGLIDSGRFDYTAEQGRQLQTHVTVVWLPTQHL